MKHKYLFLIGSLAGGGAERIFLDNFIVSKDIYTNVSFLSFYKGGNYDEIYMKNGGQFFCPFSGKSLLNKILRFLYRNVFNVIKFYSYKNIYVLLDDQYDLVPRIYWYKTLIFVMNNVDECINRSLNDYKNKVAGYIAISNQIYDELLFNGYKNIKKWKINVRTSPYFGIKVKLDGFVILASLTPQKNHFFIINAFSAYVQQGGNRNLIIIGEGPLRAELLDHISKLKLLHRCSFHSFINNFFASVEGSFGLIMASRFEGAPLSLIEASIYGIPILSANEGFDPKEILDNYEGLFISKLNSEIFASDLLNFEKFITNKYKSNKSLVLKSSSVEINFKSIEIL